MKSFKRTYLEASTTESPLRPSVKTTNIRGTPFSRGLAPLASLKPIKAVWFIALPVRVPPKRELKNL